MINVKLLPASINCDDDTRALQPTECLNIENFRVGVSADGKNFQIRNFPSTQLIYQVFVPYNNESIGTAIDLGRQRIFWFGWNDYGFHAIYTYDIPSNTSYIVLLSSQTAEGFNWDRYSRIDKNARVSGDLLLWTDDNNEPQCINIEAGIKLNQPSYVTDTDPYLIPIPYTTLTLIQRPPTFQLQVEKITDAGFVNNFTALNAYQFTYRYIYKDYQESVLATYSALIPYNNVTETFNAVTVLLPFTEDIPDYVQQVDLCVKYGNYGKTFVFKSYNKDNFYDALAIAAHNSNTTALGTTFYDNSIGIAIDTETANTSFDDVALTAGSLEIAKNRCMLAKVKKGYTTPPLTSLTVSLGTYNTGGAGTYTAQWKYFYLTYRNITTGVTGTSIYYYAYVSTLSTTSYFYITHQSITPPPSVNSSDATSSWATETQLAAWVQRNYSPPAGTVWQYGAFTFFTTGATTDVIFAVDLSGLQFFKSSSLIKVSIAFYDRYRRKCGYVNSDVTITIPQRTSTQSVFATNIEWTLSNLFATNEIPDFAWYYQIHVSKNLTTRFFLQIFVTATTYATKTATGSATPYTYSTTYTLNSTYATAFDVTPLFNNGLGYIFTEGDLLRVYKTDGTNVLLNVLGQDGFYVLTTPYDFGVLGAVGFLIEIYTPYKPSATESLFETGDMLPILNPGTSSRQYSTLSGSINGDCYAIERDKGGSSLYFCEAMSPNDKVWQIWQMDRGWSTEIDTIGQKIKETNIDWSNTFISGTKSNGLNKFGALNTKDVGRSSGAITKIQLTNKQQEDGTVLLVITETDHLSAYLQEVQLLKAAGNADIITTDEVIGTINALKNGKGSINPESIEEYQGVVWGVSVLNGVAWQYSNDGVTDISDNKMIGFFDRYCKRYIAQGYKSSLNPIHSVYDPSSDELLFVMPATEDAGFQPDLPSYEGVPPDYTSSIKNKFIIYDGKAKTLIYKPLQNKWVGSYQYIPDCMASLGNKLFGFRLADLWLFNEDYNSFNTIFGIEYPQRICIAANTNPSVIADLFNIALECNLIPNYSVAYTKLPDEQITDLVESDYVNKEGVQVAEWFRDRLSPNQTGTAEDKMYKGDVFKSNVPLIQLEFSIYDKQLILFSINLGFEVSMGNNQILQQTK